MMKKGKGKWLDSYTFVQKTVKYDKEGKQRGETEIWYEAIQYPDFFRIDYGSPELGNAVIYRNDSTYYYKEHKLDTAFIQFQEFLLVEGGMYQLGNAEEVITRLIEFGYDVQKFYSTSYNKNKVYVFGAESGDYKSKQMWIDANNFYIIRKLSPINGGRILETQYGDFKKYGNAWIENKVSFLIDGNLIQDEYYEDIDINISLKQELFDPKKWNKWHWFKN